MMSTILLFFFVKQKTAYEMRISDWSSDVCSSDLAAKIAQAPMLECIRPPGIHDSHLTMASYMRSATPARSRISPSRMNIGIETSRKSFDDDQATSHIASVRGIWE